MRRWLRERASLGWGMSIGLTVSGSLAGHVDPLVAAIAGGVALVVTMAFVEWQE